MKTILVNEAVEAAAAYCIKHDILRCFLMKNRAEVVDVCIFEYNEELHLKTVKEEGIEIGEYRLAELLKYLNASGRQEDINRALSDSDYRQELYQELHIDIPDMTE